MNSKVHFQDIVVLEVDLLGSRIGSPVSSYIVQAKASWKPHAGFQSVAGLNALVAGQRPDAILNLLGKLAHGDAGLCDGLRILADLAVDFGGFAIVVQELVIHVVHHREVTKFFSRGSQKIVIFGGIFNNLTLWISLIVKEIGEFNSRRSCLVSGHSLPFLLLVSLSFFLLAFCGWLQGWITFK
jgi:hypothetical protein